jgi:hypothetical protein
MVMNVYRTVAHIAEGNKWIVAQNNQQLLGQI